MAELLHFLEKFNMAAAEILDVLKRKSDERSISGMPFSVFVPNFVQIHVIATEL